MPEGEVPRVSDALRAVERAGIRAGDGDAGRIEGFLRRLRPQPAPERETDPWALPRTTEWRGE